jgi:hypothetical protein
MRFLHSEAASIRAYVEAHELTVTKCDFERKSSSFLVDTNSIEELLSQSDTLWGSALPYYLYVSKLFEASAPSLKEAATVVEASAETDKFLLIAYQDGGVISVSGLALPFQASAKRAEWWAPYKSAARSLK